MSKREAPTRRHVVSLRGLARKLPDTEEGIACHRPALEKSTVRARGKAFLFLGAAAGPR